MSFRREENCVGPQTNEKIEKNKICRGMWACQEPKSLYMIHGLQKKKRKRKKKMS